MTKQKINYQEYRVEQTCECADATATIITIPVPPGEYIGIRGLTLDPHCNKCGALWLLEAVRGTPA